MIRTWYDYEPFGSVMITGEASDNPFQYTGRGNDNTGLYYYRARYYSSELKRFISEDPIRLPGGINLYEYVGNNPVKRKDPTGLSH
jgi:RHS repeat-associated protein